MKIKITLKIKQIIEKNPIAFATVDEEGKPNVIAVACSKVVSSDQILITDNFMKQTKENLAKNSNVCLAVWNKKWAGYKIIGNAHYFVTGKWKRFVEKIKENRELPTKGAIVVKISKLIRLA